MNLLALPWYFIIPELNDCARCGHQISCQELYTGEPLTLPFPYENKALWLLRVANGQLELEVAETRPRTNTSEAHLCSLSAFADAQDGEDSTLIAS